MAIDDKFFERADEHIGLANDHLQKVSKGKVSASMMYGTARFNAWVSVTSYDNPEELKEKKQQIVDFFADQYIKMLNDSLDDYIENYDKYRGNK